MSATSNLGNLGQSQFGQFGQFTVNSSNPYYCEAVPRKNIISVDVSGDNITYEIDSTNVDFSKIVVGSKVIITNCVNPKNNGIKFITSVDGASDTITVTNKGNGGVSEASSNGYLEIHPPKTIGILVKEDLTITSIAFGNNVGASPSTAGYVAGLTKVGDFRELVVSAGTAELYLAPDFLTPNE